MSVDLVVSPEYYEQALPVFNAVVGDFKYKTDAEIYRHISEGGNGMTPFRGQLTDREINLMVRFVQDDLRK